MYHHNVKKGVDLNVLMGYDAYQTGFMVASMMLELEEKARQGGDLL
ncbi:hypothetical protein [Brevibacillus dissolubilis]|nr:hypothetical protein [Brevibacillus dissolubilis]